MQDPISQNIEGVQQLVGSKLNKTINGVEGNPEGVEGELRDEFTLDLDDNELLALSRLWEAKYRPYEGKIKPRQEANKTYYLGRQKEGSQIATDGQPISANLLFEAEETFIPAALSKNPEPVVWSDDSKEGTKIASDVKTMLQYHADVLVIRRKLGLMVRHWSIYFLGVMKHGWDDTIGDIKSEVRNPQNFIFDPDGFIDSYGDYEGYLGERITVTADKLIALFPKHEAFITVITDGKLGTNVTYTEWWNDEYCFYTFKNKVLDKSKNPNFNYDRIEPQQDIDGNIIQAEVKGKNHFARPKKPYTFLSVFTLGDQPHDITSLIEQNIPNQRRVSRRTEQIDYNLSRQNNSDIFSENNFNQETAKQAANAIKVGNPVLIPSGGPIDGAIKRLQGQGVDASYFNELENSKQDLRTIFGTQGITSTNQDEDQTARGAILNQQHDNSRIGGGIGDAIEQVADNTFNYWTQLYYVHYDEQHFAAIMGKMRAVEYVTLSSQDLDRRIVVSVAPDSMKPKDEITDMNLAQALYDKGAIGPKTLLTMVNFPDANGAAEDGVLWTIDKMAYAQLNFPEMFAQLQQIQMQAQQQAIAASGAQAHAEAAGKSAGTPPEGITEPEDDQGLAAPPASSALSNVPISSPALPS